MNRKNYIGKHELSCWLGIVALLVQMNAVPLDYLLFRLNQQEIARTLCEHKMPHCNGNCYLVKQLAKQANTAGEKRAEQFSFHLSGHYLSSEVRNVAFPSFEKSSSFASLIDNISTGYHTTLNQPPRSI